MAEEPHRNNRNMPKENQERHAIRPSQRLGQRSKHALESSPPPEQTQAPTGDEKKKE